MWNVIINFLSFTGGMIAGVVMMCLFQIGKKADEQMETMNTKRRDNE